MQAAELTPWAMQRMELQLVAEAQRQDARASPEPEVRVWLPRADEAAVRRADAAARAVLARPGG